jgi:hypothetical protein
MRERGAFEILSEGQGTMVKVALPLQEPPIAGERFAPLKVSPLRVLRIAAGHSQNETGRLLDIHASFVSGKGRFQKTFARVLLPVFIQDRLSAFLLL